MKLTKAMRRELLSIQRDGNPSDPYEWTHAPEGLWFHLWQHARQLERELAAGTEKVKMLREALAALLVMVSCEPEGKLTGMKDQEKRLEWYEDLMPIREQARATLEATKP